MRVPHDPVSVDEDRSGLLDDQRDLAESVGGIDRPLGVRQHGKRYREGARDARGGFEGRSAQGEGSRTESLDLIVHTPQLGEVVEAKHSREFAKEVQDHVSEAELIGERDDLSSSSRQREVWGARSHRRCFVHLTHLTALPFDSLATDPHGADGA